MLGEQVVELGLLAEAGEKRREAVERDDLGARASRKDARQAEVVDVLMGDDQQLDVLDRVTAGGKRLLELVQRLGRVRSGVDERQRGVLDQVGVHAPDLKWRRDRQAMDPGRGGGGQRLSSTSPFPPASASLLTSGSARGLRRAGVPCRPPRRATLGTGAAAARCWTRAR